MTECGHIMQCAYCDDNICERCQKRCDKCENVLCESCIDYGEHDCPEME